MTAIRNDRNSGGGGGGVTEKNPTLNLNRCLKKTWKICLPQQEAGESQIKVHM